MTQQLEFVLPPDTRMQTVELPGGLVLPSVVVIKASDWEGFDLEARIVHDGARYVCSEFRMLQRDGGAPVTSEAIRAVPIKHLVRQAIEHQLLEMQDWNRGEKVTYELTSAAQPPDPKRDGVDAMTRWVAQQYELAIALNMPPTKRIQDQLGVSRATAGRWVADARKQGLLPPAEDM